MAANFLILGSDQNYLRERKSQYSNQDDQAVGSDAGRNLAGAITRTVLVIPFVFVLSRALGFPFRSVLLIGSATLSIVLERVIIFLETGEGSLAKYHLRFHLLFYVLISVVIATYYHAEPRLPHFVSYWRTGFFVLLFAGSVYTLRISARAFFQLGSIRYIALSFTALTVLAYVNASVDRVLLSFFGTDRDFANLSVIVMGMSLVRTAQDFTVKSKTNTVDYGNAASVVSAFRLMRRRGTIASLLLVVIVIIGYVFGSHFVLPSYSGLIRELMVGLLAVIVNVMLGPA